MRSNGQNAVFISIAMLGMALLGACGEQETAVDPGETTAADMEEAVVLVEEAKDIPADAVAPKLDVPRNLPDHPEAALAAMLVKAARVPSAPEVTVPVYPGARVMNTMLDTGGMLPSMILVTEDGMSDVLAFYSGQLAGWQHEEMYGIHWMWDGPEGSNAMDLSQMYPTVTLSPIEEDDVLRVMWPELQTKIDLLWQPATP